MDDLLINLRVTHGVHHQAQDQPVDRVLINVAAVLELFVQELVNQL